MSPWKSFVLMCAQCEMCPVRILDVRTFADRETVDVVTACHGEVKTVSLRREDAEALRLPWPATALASP